MAPKKNWFAECIDYLSFCVPMDFDLGEQICDEIFKGISAAKEPMVERVDFKFRILNPTTETHGQKRYCFDFYGPLTYQAFDFIPLFFFQHMDRIDFRKSLLRTSYEMMEAYCLQRHKNNKGRRGVNPFDTPTRQKTHQRDVGGKGIRIGSGKSKQYSVAYVIKGENPAIEHRWTGLGAEELGIYFGIAVSEGTLEMNPRDFLSMVRPYAIRELHLATGCNNWPDFENELWRALLRKEREDRIIAEAAEKGLYNGIDTATIPE